jgi:hypothetical protein
VRGFPSTQPIFVLFTIIIYLPHVSVLRQEEIHTLQISSPDNGSVVFRILANLVNNGDSSLYESMLPRRKSRTLMSYTQQDANTPDKATQSFLTRIPKEEFFFFTI